jgi:hypothetical protein
MLPGIDTYIPYILLIYLSIKKSRFDFQDFGQSHINVFNLGIFIFL